MKKNFEIKSFKCLAGKNSTCRKVIIPNKEVFCYVHEKAKDGNEMALMLLFEWMQFCTPENTTERQMFDKINCAFKELFV